MRILGFCVIDNPTETTPFNSTRYYAHVSGDHADVMHYTKDGYTLLFSTEFEKFDFDALRKDTQRHHDSRKK